MPKPKLYEVALNKGRTHPEFGRWLENMIRMNGKAPDYGGINNIALIASAGGDIYVHNEATTGMKKRSEADVTVTEVTAVSIGSEHGHWDDAVNGYFSYIELE